MIDAVITYFPVGEEVNLSTVLPAVPHVGDSFSLGDPDVPIMVVRKVCWEPVDVNAPFADRRWLIEVVLGSPGGPRRVDNGEIDLSG